MYFIDEFERQILGNGDSIALTDSDGNRNISYKELDVLTNRIGNKLISVGVKKGDSVIIVLPRISEYISCEIAILKLGAVVVPLIPEYPDERVSYIKNDCNAAFIIDETFVEGISDEKSSDTFIPEDISNDDRGMIIYTSGSTGNPKGVVYTRNDIDEHIKVTLEVMNGIKPLVCGATATMSFCYTVEEYLRNLVLGAHIHIISNEIRADGRLLASYYTDHKITTGFISPRVLKTFDCKSDTLVRVFTGSDRVINTYSEDFEIRCIYGQSETIGPITSFLVDKSYDNTPIGKPLAGVEIIITDDADNEVEDGTEGQICIIGDFPHEYNNLKEQTEKTFKKLDDGRILIHTGDVGKILPDGNILFLNRNDWMIKIHGQRVEPGEIESAMNKVDGITGSIVKGFENKDGTMLLCGFYTENKPVVKEDIRRKLELALPEYMIPSAFVRMDKFPVNANGKIDRKSIEKPDLNTLTSEYEKPVGKTEEVICIAMQKILNIAKIGRKDNFLQLGGNSLNAVSLCAACGIDGLAPQLVMLGQTPEGMAKLISENSFYPKPKLTVSKVLKTNYPLSLSQKYQYKLCKRQGKTIDCIDTLYFFKLDEAIDIPHLKTSVETVVNAHMIYKSHIDIDNELMFTDDTGIFVGDVSLEPDEFSKFRQDIYKRVRDLKNDPLFEAKILHVRDDSDYLFICVCHMVYDGKSLKNLFDGISSEYTGVPIENEQASIFDLIENECRIMEDKKLIEAAQKVLASNYEGLKTESLFDSDTKYETAASKIILEEESKTEIDTYLKKYGISILTLFQAAMEITVSKIFKTQDFCYMNVYDGRGDELLNMSHGVFAKSVFMRSNAGKYDDLKEYFISIEEQYQRLVYYDILDTFKTVSEYPEIMSGITFNLRDMQGSMIKLGAKPQMSEFLDEINEAYKPFTDFDFIVNRLPKGYGFLATVASIKVSESFANEFITCFKETMLDMIHDQ